jgi:predicted RecB family nuclease
MVAVPTIFRYNQAAFGSRRLYYEEKGVAMTRLSGARGIAPEEFDLLKKQGITTSDDLLKRGAAFEGRDALAAQTGIAELTLTRLVGRADLERINGITWDSATLLQAAGVESVPELVLSEPEKLLTRLVEANQAQQIVKRTLTAKQLLTWIAAAREVPPIITYRPMEIY